MQLTHSQFLKMRYRLDFTNWVKLGLSETAAHDMAMVALTIRSR